MITLFDGQQSQNNNALYFDFNCLEGPVYDIDAMKYEEKKKNKANILAVCENQTSNFII